MLACRSAVIASLCLSIALSIPFGKGEKNVSNDLEVLTSRVVNGVPVTDPKEYPFVVDLSAHPVAISSSRFCTGTLIRENILLTAAHCVLNDGYSNPVYATVGRIELDDGHKANKRAKTFKTIASIVHPEYEGLGSSKDIAIMLLNESSNAPNVVLSEKTPKENSETWVVGYGIESIGTVEGADQHVELMSGRLQKTALRIKEKSFCDIPGTDFRTQAGMLCTAGVKAGSSACKGDSGGGLFLTEKHREAADLPESIQVGVVSYGDAKCMSEDSGVFTDVASVKSWIDLAASRLQAAFQSVRIQLKDAHVKELFIDDASAQDDLLPFVTRTSRKGTEWPDYRARFYTVRTDFTGQRTVVVSLCDESEAADSGLFMVSETAVKPVTGIRAKSCRKGKLSELSFKARQGTYVIGVKSSKKVRQKLILSSSGKK